MIEDLSTISDLELINEVRAGNNSAFGVLYERYLGAARRMAQRLVTTPAEQEDLVAEAFARVLGMLRRGRGPDDELRAYLRMTLRNLAVTNFRRSGLVSPHAYVPDVRVPTDDDDPVIERWNSDLAAKAFATLPERWRVVLWHTAIEKKTPAEVAELLGMRPNAAAALAYRAREGLRKAYLGLHLSEVAHRECGPTLDRLAALVRNSLPAPLSRKVHAHLRNCPDCRERARLLTEVNAELPRTSDQRRRTAETSRR